MYSTDGKTKLLTVSVNARIKIDYLGQPKTMTDPVKMTDLVNLPLGKQVFEFWAGEPPKINFKQKRQPKINFKQKRRLLIQRFIDILYI